MLFSAGRSVTVCIDGDTRFEWPFRSRLRVTAAELDDDRLAHLVRGRVRVRVRVRLRLRVRVGGESGGMGYG